MRGDWKVDVYVNVGCEKNLSRDRGGEINLKEKYVKSDMETYYSISWERIWREISWYHLLNKNPTARCGITSYKLSVMEYSEGSKTMQAHGILGYLPN